MEFNPNIKLLGGAVGGAGFGGYPKIGQQQQSPQMFGQPNYDQYDAGSLNHPVCKNEFLANKLDLLG